MRRRRTKRKAAKSGVGGFAKKAKRSLANRALRLAAVVAFGFYVGFFYWNQTKPMPPGTSIDGEWHELPEQEVSILWDLTYREDDETLVEQSLFDKLLELVEEAESFVVLDQFLFNDFAGEAEGQRPLSEELTAALERKLETVPDLRVLFVTDPINEIYGGEQSPFAERLRMAGADVVWTDLSQLRDSNPLYSSLWRMAFAWLGNTEAGGWLPNPFGGSETTLRSWLRLLNFKANHRKVAIADSPQRGLRALVASANPHDASSRHSNIGVVFSGGTARALLDSELDVARFSGWQGDVADFTPDPESVATATDDEAAAAIRLVTEGAIRASLVDHLSRVQPGDSVDMAMFYLADRQIVEGLVKAAKRGAQVRLILDANRDAFGRQKDGVPNRPVAHELVTEGGGRILVRWYHTEGEQFHTKLTVIRHQQQTIASLGSANLTRRNIGDFNLEANVELRTEQGSSIDDELRSYFDRLWSNEGKALFTEDFAAFADGSRFRYWRYRLMEASGLSTF